MPKSLSEDSRKRLDGIVAQMEANGEPEASVRAVVADFSDKYGAEPTPAHEDSYPVAVAKRFAGSVKHLAGDPRTGAFIGATAAAPFTAGLSVLPAMVALAGAGAAGSAATGARDVRTMATEGALAAGGEGLARGASKMLTIGGQKLYKAILRPSIPLQREFGDVSAAGLREGATVGEQGANKIAGRLSSSANHARQLVTDAEAAGAAPVTTKEVASEFSPVFQQGRKQAQLGRPDPRPAVVARLKTFDARNPNGISLGRAQELKSEAQDLASRAYRAEDRGGVLTDLGAASDQAMARGLRKGIETRVPEVGPVNAHTQELIGVQRALEDANMRNVPGVGLVRTLMGGFAPRASSGVAIGADRVGRSPSLAEAMRAALIAALGGQ